MRASCCRRARPRRARARGRCARAPRSAGRPPTRSSGPGRLSRRTGRRTRPRRASPSRTRRPGRARSARGCSRTRRSSRSGASRRRAPPAAARSRAGSSRRWRSSPSRHPRRCASASRAASYAGPPSSPRSRFRSPARGRSSDTPKGFSPSRWRISERLRLDRILLRMDTQAHLGARVRDDGVDRLVDGQDVDSGHRHRRARPDPLAEAAGAEEGNARQDLGQLAELVVAVRRARPLLAAQSGNRHVAVRRRASACERVQQRDQRVGRGAAELAAVLRAGERRASTVIIAIPRSATVSVGTPGRTLPMSPITIASAANSSGRSGGKVRERTPTSSMPFDHDLDPDRRLPVPGPQRADVHQDVRLRVGGAAAVDRPVALGRLERRRLPLGLVADRHDVVVAVEQNGRRAVGSGDLAQSRRAQCPAARAVRGSSRPRRGRASPPPRRPRAAGRASTPGSPERRWRGSRPAAPDPTSAAASAARPSPPWSDRSPFALRSSPLPSSLRVGQGGLALERREPDSTVVDPGTPRASRGRG